MALSLIEAQERARKAMLRRDARTLRELRDAYRSAYRFIRKDADKLLDTIARAREAGETIGPFWLSQQKRYQDLLAQIQRRIDSFSLTAANKITAAQSDLAAMGAKDSLALIGASLPPEILTSFNLLPARAIDNLIGFLSDGSPLADLLAELGPQAERMVSQALINGLASGSPIRRIAKTIQNALGGNLTRALNIARTESLRAYREASRETYVANKDVVTGWVWLAALSPRTCAVCFAMHGTEHSNNETLDSHPSCRCTSIPITRTWRDLGIAMDEPKRDYGDALAWITSQPVDTQRRIFGRAGYAAFSSGRATLQDFVGTHIHPRWGTTRYVRPIGEILGQTERRAA